MKKIYIVIPSFNEAEMLPTTIKSLQQEGYHNIIVVDDGSSDNTKNALKNKNVIFLHHSINRGQGAAVKTGMEAAKLLHADIVVTFDADGQHDPKDIERLLNKLNKGYDVILGYRNLSRKTMPVFNIWANYMANLITQLFYGIQIKDSQCGLRVYGKKAMACIDTQGDRYEFYSEVIREIVKNNLRFAEEPVNVYYTKYATSKRERQNIKNALKTVYRMFLSL